ncbi:olfactory receptor 5V1-like [Terrapene carolina triunguis]|uniref:olfactory receptor 5V1-like n=1 Tax=Terrapene triunguis TaxID=2587831 RepID=UPI000E775D32|nr:olfactory receptor 5V1-like [Terrapene carolina triunguis]
MELENQTTVTEFILLGFSSDPQLQIFLFVVFLIIYLITLVGNMLIMLVIRADSHLHTPMYFFLSNLSFLDICFSTVTVPKMLESFLAKWKTISVGGCLVQLFFFLLSGCAEVFMLSAMAYDRFAAICHPLHYLVTMKKQVCILLVGGAWTMGFLYSLVNTLPMIKLHFCGPTEINHFSCELPPLLLLSCTETFTNKVVLLSSAVLFGLSSFLLTLISYIHIISTILKMHSVEGRYKAFSTCSSHLIVVGLFYSAAFFQYMKPTSKTSSDLESLVSIQYSILTPMLNPVIYTLKNKEVKTAVWKLLG